MRFGDGNFVRGDSVMEMCIRDSSLSVFDMASIDKWRKQDTNKRTVIHKGKESRGKINYFYSRT